MILCLPIISLVFKCRLYSELEIPNTLSYLIILYTDPEHKMIIWLQTWTRVGHCSQRLRGRWKHTNRNPNIALDLLFPRGFGFQTVKFASKHTFPDFGMLFSKIWTPVQNTCWIKFRWAFIYFFHLWMVSFIQWYLLSLYFQALFNWNVSQVVFISYQKRDFISWKVFSFQYNKSYFIHQKVFVFCICASAKLFIFLPS